MQKKLTLSINEDLIEFAHVFSKKTNQSISHIVEEYLNELKKQENNPDKNNFKPKINKLYGAFESQPIPDKKELRRNFHEKNYN
ncbi:DUF6364 family protein [Halothermothrix orenii]|uniref:Uncharacterized protein n=1 Tax=Halothermothrix orenii (strain H 168 / OCM 544 / DSM 9562) TaxID=373903 RepID=B8CXV2_HALOH|nr:DUF6364 family protein [Halothermothrix orenii]ACL70121.1 hypothetical protein Hore_13690 [Halothermothrix orenii H 168]